MAPAISRPATARTATCGDRWSRKKRFQEPIYHGTGTLAASDRSNRYLWGPVVDQLLADEQIDWTNNEANGEVLWALTDHLGTVRDLVNDAGVVQNHKSYNAFGNVTAETNAAKDAVFGFTGKLFDDAIGLQNNLHRWYDANVGSWMSEDPIGFAAGDANLGRYVGNQPTILTDPTGEIAPIAIGIGAGIAWWFSGTPVANAPAPGDTPIVVDPWGPTIPQTSAGVGVAASGNIAYTCLTAGAAVGGGAGLGVGTQAVLAPGLGAGSWPALLINGEVYAARFHAVAWGLAGNNPNVQKYGIAIIDETGKVIGWLGK